MWSAVAAAALALAAAPVRAEAPDVNQLVAKADALRQVYSEAVMQVRLTRQGGEDAGKETLMRVAVRGADASLIRVLQGPDQGQQLLMLNEGLWLKLPRSTRTLRITPLQRLMGDASVGDIGRLRWQDDYEARYAEPADTVFEGAPAWRIELTARRDGAPYPRILATLAKQDARPLEAEFFLKSGKAIKAVRFGPVEPINDRRGVRRMEFRDLVKTDSRTLLVLEKVEPRSLEPRLFTLETLGSWQ
jgi:hypothetical protein